MGTSRLRIGLDGAPLLGDRGGVGWHTYYLLRALLDLKEDVEFVVYVPRGSLHNALPSGWTPRQGLRWVETRKLFARFRGRHDGLDLYHGTNFKMRTVGRYGGVVTIHDLWLDRYPQYSKKLFGQRASFYRTRHTAWRARKVITVSQHSARDIASLYALPSERIVVIHNGVSEEFRPMTNPADFAELRDRLALPNGRFILFVGGADPRKNHQTLLKACAGHQKLLKDHHLVLVGDRIHHGGDMAATARSLGIEDRVICTGRLPISDVRTLYSHAAMFAFPSLYEGFGMPVLEAMACGAPVITSSSTSLPELAGDAALLIDPENPEDLAQAIARIQTDQALSVTLRNRGFARSKAFTWEEAAKKTMAVYRESCFNET